MSSTQQHGGKREGAGRPKGAPSRRTLAEVAQLAKLYPKWTPLFHFAHVANDESLPADIRLDAAKAAAPYVHARLKGIDGDPDALVELEGRIHAARLHAAADALAERPGLAGLAERLARADARDAIQLASLVSRQTIDVEPASPPPEPPPEPVEAAPAAPEPKPAAPKPAPYRPILDWPECTRCFSRGLRSPQTLKGTPMATIAENIIIIKTQAAELDTLIASVRAAKAAIEQAEYEIRRERPVSDPSRAYQERLALVALDAMGKPSIARDPSIAALADMAWAGVE